MKTQTIAIVVVAVVIAASAGAYFVLNNNERTNTTIDAPLSIMGNVNQDKSIDDSDLELLKSIIADGKTSSYPLADVNNDGKVDADDVEALEKMLRREAMKVYLRDDSNTIVGVDYPLRNIVTINADMLSIISVLGAKENLIAYIASSYPTEQSYIRGDASIKDLGSGRAIKESEYKEIKNISSGLAENDENIGAILYMSEASLGDYRADLEAAGIPLVWVNCTGPFDYAGALLNLGYLFGGDFEDKGKELYGFCYDIYGNIENKVGDRERVKCISFSMFFYLTEKESQYTKMTIAAGGNNVTDLEGNGSSALASTDAVTKYDVDRIINFRTLDLVKSDKHPKDSWENKNVNTYLKASAAFENMVFVNASMPVCIRVAYIAEIFYPDLFTGYGNQVFQDFVDRYMAYLDANAPGGKFDVTRDTTTIITHATYLDSLKE